MAKSKNGKTAVGLSVLGTFLVLLAFCTKYWLVTDGTLTHPKFEKIGLWVVCFKDYEDSHHWYETKFSKCFWVLDKKLSIIHDILSRDFYIATQFFFTACIFFTIFGSFFTALYTYLNRSCDHYIQILLNAGGLHLAAAICSTNALIIFGIYGDSRSWMPNWDHNDIGWSYGVAVAGTIALYVSALLYIIEARVFKNKCKQIAAQLVNDGFELS